MKSLLFALTVVLAVPVAASAQRRSYDPYRILKSEYLQQDLKLTKEQIKRIEQYSLQAEGIRALRRDEIARELGITESQKKKMKSVYDGYNTKRSEAYKLYRTNRTEGRKKFEALRTEYKDFSKMILDVLTNSQKQKFEKMKGKPFDRAKLFPRRSPKKQPERPDV